MAMMIPEDVDRFTTDGERQFYGFLKKVAKPDAQYISWYTPDIKGREPDFLLFNRRVGIIVFEVKDWTLDQIQKANPDQFFIYSGGKHDSRTNPLKQARQYTYDIIDKIKSDGKLISKDPIHYGKLQIPFSYGVIFPNINKHEYTLKGFDRVIGTDKIFFWDDLHPSSNICCDSTGACFSQAMERMFPSKFEFKLTHGELNHLKQLIFPEVKIKLPARESAFPFPDRVARLKGLDHHQESFARKFDGGHRIITGPSGSGKTLILVHKAAFLLKYNPDIKNILFVCYNITLVNYIRRLLADREVPLGDNGVQVYHFYQLCSEIIKEEVAYENEDSDYYDLVVQETLQKVKNCGSKYDAILVDEGQDFSNKMYRIVSGLLNLKTNNLTIVCDDNQDIYRPVSTWKEAGVQARGRVHKVSYVYRSTIEISAFAANFNMKKEGEQNDKKTKQLELFPEYFDFHGPTPKMKRFSDFSAIVTYVIQTISEVIKSELCPFSEIAIIYAMKSPGEDLDDSLPALIKKGLESKGILSNWVSENYRSKKDYDITTNRVTISSIHSVKGLDYSCVFLLGIDFLKPKTWSEEQLHKLTYVAITRARYQLFIPYVKEKFLIERLKKSL